MFGDGEDERWMSSERKAEKRLTKALSKHLPEDAVTEIVGALKEYVGAIADDLRDRMDGSGTHDPNY